MKRIFLVVALFSSFISTAVAQLTIGTSDLPSAGDTFRLSVANPLAGADYTLTGPNYTWDFSTLTSQSQRVDTFLSVSATSIVFNVVFANVNFNPNRANMASGGADFNLGTVAVNDVYNFYYNGTSGFSQVGFGATIAGLPAPFTYDLKDFVYSFPLDYGDIDTSRSSYQVDLTSTLGLYFKVNRTRINQVDGWGSLTTPYGTHNVLRVRTVITERDSVYIDSLGFGLNLPPFTNIEYKWLGAGEGVPLLQANANANGVVNQVLYREGLAVNTGVATKNEGNGVELYPNPVTDKLNIANTTGASASFGITLLDLQGKIVLDEQMFIAAGTSVAVNLSDLQLSPGNYLVRVYDETSALVRLISMQ